MSADHDLPKPSRNPAEDALWADYEQRRAAGVRAGVAFEGTSPGALASRNALIEYYLPLCRTIAAGLYARRGGLEVEFLDYMQFATIGMIEAVERFDPALGNAFNTFATP